MAYPMFVKPSHTTAAAAAEDPMEKALLVEGSMQGRGCGTPHSVG